MFPNKTSKINKDQKGVSLIISFFIMVIIVAIVLAITTLLYNEIKMIRNIGNSVVAFYAADSGIEKVLYYDRKVIPVGSRGYALWLNIMQRQMTQLARPRLRFQASIRLLIVTRFRELILKLLTMRQKQKDAIRKYAITARSHSPPISLRNRK
jgi:hypothetical protein